MLTRDEYCSMEMALVRANNDINKAVEEYYKLLPGSRRRNLKRSLTFVKEGRAKKPSPCAAQHPLPRRKKVSDGEARKAAQAFMAGYMVDGNRIQFDSRQQVRKFG